MKKQRLFTVLASASAALLLMVGLTSSYLTDVEVKDNIITIGKVDIELDEGGFDTEKVYDVVPGSRVVKAPKLVNTGTKDEFVFLRITVPKGKVTLLHETGVHKGTPDTAFTAEKQELFRILADDTDPFTENVRDKLGGLTANTLTEGTDSDFQYRSGSLSGDGWVLISAAVKNNDTTEWDEYVFGYSRKLLPDEETLKLFDEVQLKSFIDGEAVGETDIGVYGYAIQADNLKPEGNIDFDKVYFELDDLSAVYTIVKNKAKLT